MLRALFLLLVFLLLFWFLGSPSFWRSSPVVSEQSCSVEETFLIPPAEPLVVISLENPSSQMTPLTIPQVDQETPLVGEGDKETYEEPRRRRR